MVDKKLKLLAVAAAVIILIPAVIFVVMPSLEDDDDSEGFVVTDMYHREVVVPEQIDHLLAIGAHALRMVSYLDCGDKIIATESREGPNFNAKSYMYANPGYAEINTLDNSPLTNMEAILALDPKPDLIIMGEATSAWDPQLQMLAAAGIPVVGILDIYYFDDFFEIQLRLLGKVLQKEQRAEELITYIHGVMEDLDDRTAGIAAEDRPTVYVGATAWSGIRPFEYSTHNYGPFKLINANNVITSSMTANTPNPVGFDLETIVDLDPEYVFIEATGYTNVANAYNSEKKAVFDSMSAFAGGPEEWDVYMCVPFIWYFVNFDNILVSAYYMGSVLYPEQFADVNITEKANEIYQNFVGAEVFEDMDQWFFDDRGCHITGRASF